MNGPRQCPRCRLLNDPTAAVCDCGHEFATGQLRVRPDPDAPPSSASAGRSFPSTGALRAAMVVVVLLAGAGLRLKRAHDHSAERAVWSDRLRQRSYTQYHVTMTGLDGESSDRSRAFVDRFHDGCFEQSYDSSVQGLLALPRKYQACMDQALREQP